MDVTKDGKRISAKSKQVVLIIFVLFCTLILCAVTSMIIKESTESRRILEDSIRSQLISISAAAREIIDAEAFLSYNTRADILDNSAYQETLFELRALADNVNAKYIYALKQIDSQAYFIFDTDRENDTAFTAYELFPVHAAAFQGEEAADVMNVNDKWGSFNTGAVPILKDGEVIGIVSADIEDIHIAKSIASSRFNITVLIVFLVAIMVMMCAVLYFTLTRVKEMQDRLHRMAHYDKLTGLPNRQYLLEHLASITARKSQAPFALLFIDLNDFKLVNDTAGHDAGDALLRNLGLFLDNVQKNTKVFRPGAGALSVTARIGGDEFILIAPEIGSVGEAEHFCKEILDQFHEASDTIDQQIAKCKVDLSIGASLFPYHSENYHVILKYADIAMYHAKEHGSGYCVYSENIDNR